MPAAFHNQKARNGVKASFVSTLSLGFNGFEFFSLQLAQINTGRPASRNGVKANSVLTSLLSSRTLGLIWCIMSARAADQALIKF